jgi:hypothetical protein
MAFEAILRSLTLPASGDLSTKQYLFVMLNGSGQIATAVAGSAATGVLQDKPNVAGHGGNVAVGGVSKIYAGGTITAGNRVSSDANGAAIASTAASGSQLGQALTSGVAGDLISVLLLPADAGAVGGSDYHLLVAGAAAGNVTVTGIATTDQLQEVLYFVGAGTAVTDITDLTSQFTITATNTINNTGGTSSSGAKLLVRWKRRTL